MMTTKNPYKVESPALISFSGGRTSGYMLYHILDAFDGKLPEGVYVTFANTGKERTETLDFVLNCQNHWNVPIHWLEYRPSDKRGKHDKYVEVDYESASREGEPYNMIIEKRNYLPNPVTRFCTTVLKVEVLQDFALSTMGLQYWTNVIGLRADESNRVTTMLKKNESNKFYTSVAPMYEAGAMVDDVMNFWSKQPFDLGLHPDEGNCDLCFLKGAAKISNILRAKPELAQWWIDREQQIDATFRKDRPNYQRILEAVQSQSAFDFGIFDDETTCSTNACTD
jgi:3'-phosphoadenosine 5'-phosphosulfate sulfotransferase (PAPS reductase)/FAD synthetase